MMSESKREELSEYSVGIAKDGLTTLTISSSGMQTKMSMSKEGWEQLIRMIRASYDVVDLKT